MRLWSVHPKYLDSRGLVALWREGLLAKRVLERSTKGYLNHPQLIRFKAHERPIALINAYLYQVWIEACKRGYKFNMAKMEPIELRGVVTVTRGQLKFELSHLIRKLERRDLKKLEELKKIEPSKIEANAVFEVVEGDVEEWERASNSLKTFTMTSRSS